MTANSANREDCRDKLAALFSASLSGSAGAAQAVYGYQIGDFAGASPVVLVLSSGTSRTQATLGTSKNFSIFRLAILNFVASASAAQSWTEANVEDRLDLLEKSEADVIADNRGKGNDATLPWDYIEIEEGSFSQIQSLSIGGAKYWVESYFVQAQVRDT
jgi:hypothetical protein